jgi:hypothetical protein
MFPALSRRQHKNRVAKDLKFHEKLRKHWNDVEWLKQKWQDIQTPTAPSWKFVAIARSCQRLGVEIEISAKMRRIWANRRFYGEATKTWIPLFILWRMKVKGTELPIGVEPTTADLQGPCSTRLSYGSEWRGSNTR